MATQNIANGFYWGRLLQAGTAVSKEKKTPYIFLEFDVYSIAGKNGEWITMPQAVTCSVNLYLSDAAWAITEKQLAELGFKGDFNAVAFDPKIYSDGCMLDCKNEVYKGKMQEKWSLSTDGFEREAADRDTLTILANRWKQSAAAKPKLTAPIPPRPAPAAPNQGPPSDETSYPPGI